MNRPARFWGRAVRRAFILIADLSSVAVVAQNRPLVMFADTAAFRPKGHSRLAQPRPASRALEKFVKWPIFHTALGANSSERVHTYPLWILPNSGMITFRA